MVMTAALAPQTMLSSEPPASCCPNCGFNLPLPSQQDSQSALRQAQRQIDDLEAQVRLLNEKASAAVDRWADYEDELARLRLTLDNRQEQQRHSTSTAASSAPSPSPARSSFLPAGAATRISALLSPRKPLPAAPQGANAPRADATTEELLTALSREQYLRKEAEGRLSETSREVEDLSVTLFEQANEMVATERRARAKLEERVEVLERRDWEKRSRLEKLEAAMGRIERVRRVLGEPVPRKAGEVGDGEEEEDERTDRAEELVR
ncbi:hypothetical protein BR93DRAFT_936311 [Coniochaeta sp. PMI_546]|nr:hypothetical protein BR93DRAFT_936311 [Coniochaeta sp. PMI_546]